MVPAWVIPLEIVELPDDASYMRDYDIRQILMSEIAHADPQAVILEELPICRIGRADVASLGSNLNGFEIKSQHDSMNRLPSQIQLYDQVFEFCHAVIAKKHMAYAQRILPSHWGVFEVSASGELQKSRDSTRNPHVSAEAIARLIWKSEAIRILKSRGMVTRHKMLVREIWGQLESLPLGELLEAAKQCLRGRCGSKGDSPQK